MITEYALVRENQIIEYPIIDLRSRFPNTSFAIPITESQLPDGVMIVKESSQPIPLRFQKLISGVSLVNGIVTKTYDTEVMSQVEIDDFTLNTATEVRLERNRLLNSSDWTQVADAPVDKLAWGEYRKQLRDISMQEGFPFNITWPIAPINTQGN